jgi:pimeloyl-ACP methyl ester carboxylesterase
VLLLHGLTDSWRSFEPALRFLPDDLRVIALSQRGHGDAARLAGGYRTRDFAEDAAALLKALDAGPAIIVGHSMGSTNALRFAIDFPELTRGLVLLGSFAGYERNPVIRELWASVSQLTDPIDPGFALEFQRSTLAQPVPPDFLDVVVQESLKVPARIWRTALAGLMEDDFVREIDRIKTPTRILWGDHDALCPRSDQEALLRAIAGSQLVVYEGAGHALHWEEPERFAADLVDFAGRFFSPLEEEVVTRWSAG